MSRFVVTDQRDLIALFEIEASVGDHWRVVTPEMFSLAACAHDVAILDSRSSPVDGVSDGRLTVSYRIETSTRYASETYRRDAFVDILSRFGSQTATGFRSSSHVIRGESLVMQRVREQVERVARFQNVPVLVLGETGTGKELVARAVHDMSLTAREPFVALNCAAIPANLFESELFGHAAGSFSGASKARLGFLEEARTGTVFLDEVGDLPSELQPKLLRVLEERQFRRVGSNEMLPLRARVVSATHLDVARSRVLRRDLFYRLSGFTITLPALRDRTSDIHELATAFLVDFSARHGMPSVRLSIEAELELSRYRWPGNVRELRSVVDRAAILSDAGFVRATDVVEAIRHAQAQSPPPRPSSLPPAAPRAAPPAVEPVSSRVVAFPSTPRTLPEIERDVLEEAFRESRQNVSETARRVGLPRSTVRDRLRKLGILLGDG